MNNILNNRFLKLFLILGAAYFVSDFSSKSIFLAGTPKLNPFAANNMIVKARSFVSNTGAIVASLNPLNFIKRNENSDLDNIPPTQVEFAQDIDNALQAPLNQVSKGVYAGEKDGYQVTEVKIGEFEYLEYTFNIRGKDVKIRVPKDQEPPSQETMEKLY